MPALANPFSAQSRIKNEVEKALENWDESKPMPKRIVVTVAKKNPSLPAHIGNVNATVELSYE
jgi:hypothetical protein